jgi:transcriptional regulator with XRE-family HTH domain
MTVEDLAERVGVASGTVRRLEQGDPTVAIGIAFEAAVIVGVTLFDGDPSRRRLEAERVADRLALLPSAVRQRGSTHDF